MAPIGLGFGVLLLAGVAAFSVLRARPGPPPKEIAGDPLLVSGREVYLARCVSCHGTTGRGDGPIAKGLAGPPPRDLTAAEWKHGDRPETVLRLVAKGVDNTAMPGWSGTLSPEELRGVTAYAYYLGGRPVPDVLRRN